MFRSYVCSMLLILSLSFGDYMTPKDVWSVFIYDDWVSYDYELKLIMYGISFGHWSRILE